MNQKSPEIDEKTSRIRSSGEKNVRWQFRGHFGRQKLTILKPFCAFYEFRGPVWGPEIGQKIGKSCHQYFTFFSIGSRSSFGGVSGSKIVPKIDQNWAQIEWRSQSIAFLANVQNPTRQPVKIRVRALGKETTKIEKDWAKIDEKAQIKKRRPPKTIFYRCLVDFGPIFGSKMLPQ